MKRKFYSVLYVAIFALLMSGCSMSGIADGSRSAVKGYEKETVEDTSESENTTVAEKKITPATRHLKAVRQHLRILQISRLRAWGLLIFPYIRERHIVR